MQMNEPTKPTKPTEAMKEYGKTLITIRVFPFIFFVSFVAMLWLIFTGVVVSDALHWKIIVVMLIGGVMADVAASGGK